MKLNQNDIATLNNGREGVATGKYHSVDHTLHYEVMLFDSQTLKWINEHEIQSTAKPEPLSIGQRLILPYLGGSTITQTDENLTKIQADRRHYKNFGWSKPGNMVNLPTFKAICYANN